MSVGAPSRRETALKVAALLALVWVVYWNSLDNPFLFDDWHVIPDNPAVRGPSDVPSFFTDVSTFSILVGNRDYRPLFLTSMALAWWVGGGATLPFHIVSLLLHSGVAVLTWLACRRTFGSGLPQAERENAAFVAAALFAVHPLASESVNYISSQSVPLASFFYLLAFVLFLGVYARAGSSAGIQRTLARSGSWLAYLAALLSKPIAITLPINLLLWELLLAPRGESVGRRAVKHLPYAAISVLFVVLRRAVFPSKFGGEQPIRPLWDHYLTQTKAMVFYYLRLGFAPFGLNADREYPLSTSLLDGGVIVALLLAGGLGFVLCRFRRRRSLLFWSLWFPVCLLVTTFGVVLRQVVNEHRVYLSLVGLCAVVGYLVGLAYTKLRVRALRLVLTTALLLLLSGFAWSTIARNRVWSSELNLWRDAAAAQGTWRAHMNHGLALEAEGLTEQALEEFERAVELGPYAYAHLNLGLAYLKRERRQEGLEHLHTAVRLWPGSPETHLYLAWGLEVVGRLDEAEDELRQALELRPNYLMAYRRLGELYEKRGSIADAIAAYREHAAIDPGQSWAANRVRLLESRLPSPVQAEIDQANEELAAGRLEQAVALLEAARPREPDDPQLLFSLAFALWKLDRQASSVEVYEQLLTVAPDHRQGTFNLAYAYLRGADSEDWDRSATLFERVLEIDPSYTEALFHLASVSWNLGRHREARRYDQQYVEQGQNEDLKLRSTRRLAADAERGGS